VKSDAGELDGSRDRLLAHKATSVQFRRRGLRARIINDLETQRGGQPCTFVHKLWIVSRRWRRRYAGYHR
jgi:hypothetical protein